MAFSTISPRAAVPAAVLALSLLPACGGKPAAPAAAAVTAPSASAGPANALASAAGRPGAVRLDARQRGDLADAVAHAPAAERKTLRYALATDDHGTPHLVVYDGQGLGADGRDPRKPHQYVVFNVLNMRGGVHYDPQQNSIVDPIPPPVQRDSLVAP